MTRKIGKLKIKRQDLLQELEELFRDKKVKNFVAKNKREIRTILSGYQMLIPVFRS